MGDKIVISNIEFLYGRLFQIDLYNEKKRRILSGVCRKGRAL